MWAGGPAMPSGEPQAEPTIGNSPPQLDTNPSGRSELEVRDVAQTAQEPRYLHAVRGVGVRISAPQG